MRAPKSYIYKLKEQNTMSPIEQEAFIQAYINNGAAPESHVRYVLALIEEDKDVPYDEYYTGIFDALSVWHEACHWQVEFMKSAYATN
jgi:hypothetical protein